MKTRTKEQTSPWTSHFYLIFNDHKLNKVLKQSLLRPLGWFGLHKRHNIAILQLTVFRVGWLLRLNASKHLDALLFALCLVRISVSVPLPGQSCQGENQVLENDVNTD
jgi:hypothetical protein